MCDFVIVSHIHAIVHV